MTRREEIIYTLEQGFVSLQEIANKYQTTLFDILEDFDHIKKTTIARGKRLVSEPAVCRDCGFEFKERSKIKTPSKCPKCRNERIEPPKFRIVL